MTRTKLRPIMVSLIIGTSILFAAAGARGQSGDADDSNKLIDLKFAGGTIAEYLDRLRQLSGDAMNIVVSDDLVGRLRLPAIELKGVRAQTALNIISDNYRMDDGTEVMLSVGWIGPMDSFARPVVRLSTTRLNGPSPPRVKVWTLSDLIGDGLAADDALTAVEIAVELSDPSAKPADVRFHEPTSLLVASGTPRQIDSINDVVDQLQERQHQRHEVEGIQHAAQGIDDLFSWIEEMRKFDASQEQLARQKQARDAADHEIQRQPNTDRDTALQREIERLARLVEDQSKKIQSLEKRLDAAPKK